MTNLDDETLVAYVDGELEPEQRESVEAGLGEDPAAREKVRTFRESAAMLRATYDPVLAEPVPERLRAAVEGAALRDEGASVHEFRRRRSVPGGATKPALALAASIVLLIGVTAGFILSEIGPGPEGSRLAGPWPDWVAVAGVDFQRALETSESYQPLEGGGEQAAMWSVAPLSTFKDRTGRYCREFELEATTGGMTRGAFGMACRDRGGTWGVELFVAQAISEATGTSGEDYAPAAAGPDAYGALVEGLISGELLGTGAEAAAIANGWK